MIKTLSYLLLAALAGAPMPAFSDSTIPNANLQVTVQQKQEGEVAKGFHVLELTCWNGDCSLSTVSLNQCFESGPGRTAFFPKVQYSATSLGNLKVKNEGKSLVVQETGSDMFGDYVTNLRFDYETAGRGEIVNRLIGFREGRKGSAIDGLLPKPHVLSQWWFKLLAKMFYIVYNYLVVYESL